jgi:hypothetical protein
MYFHEWLVDEVKRQTNFSEPPEEVDEKNEAIIGELPEKLKALFTVFVNQIEDTKEMVNSLKAIYGEDIDDVPEEKVVELMKMEARVKVLELLFWYEVREFFDINPSDSIGIRRNFVVVKKEREESNLGGIIVISGRI